MRNSAGSFLPRDAMLAMYMLWLWFCLSVRLSASLSQVDVLLKRLNIGSRKQNRTIAKGGRLVLR